MFEGDWTALDARATLVAVGQCHETEHRAARGKLLAAVHYADLHEPGSQSGSQSGTACPGGERGVVLGGPGCPPVREFVAAEFGAMIGVSAGSAAHFIGQALVLRHKLPRTWAMVLDGEATPWKACKIATACLDLSEAAAAIVDRKVAGIVDTVNPERLDRIVKAAIRRADPEAAEAEAKRKARERGVHVGRSDEHGTKKIWVRAATGDVIRFDATIDSIAQALKLLGDTDTLRHRRATAIGIIADPDLTTALLTHTRDLPQTPTPTHDSADGADTTSAPADDADPTPAPANGPDSTTAPANASDSVPAPAGGSDSTPAPAGASDTTSARADASNTMSARADASDTATAPAKAWDSTPAGVGVLDRWTYPDLLESDLVEPGVDDEADRDAPHPSESDLPDPLDTPARIQEESWDSYACDPDPGNDDGEEMDPAARRALTVKLAQLKQQAHRGTRAGGSGRGPARTELVVHLTDHTLAAAAGTIATGTGSGVLRVERVGPALASQLGELIGYGPYLVRPVIDLKDRIPVDAYEVPDRIRERVKLLHPFEQFPFGTAETSTSTDMDHIKPYDPTGPPGQTSTDNLIPLRRFSHRLKTHAGWRVRLTDDGALLWTSPHGFEFRVDHRGTHRIEDD